MRQLQNLPLQFNHHHLGITAATLLLSAYALYRYTSKHQGDDCPVVTDSSLMFGSTREYWQDPTAFIEKWATSLGPVYRVHLFGKMQTVVSGLYVQEVLRSSNFCFTEALRDQFDILLLLDTPDCYSKDFPKAVLKFLATQSKKFTSRVANQISISLDEKFGNLKEPMLLDSLFPTLQHLVAKATASVFVGEELCKNAELVETFKNITRDISKESQLEHSWMNFFSTVRKLRMWYVGKYSQKVKMHRQRLLRAMSPEIDRRIKGSSENDPSWKKPDDILQDIIENYSPPASYSNDIYTYYVNWVILLIFASIHTTSDHVTIVLYRLIQHPEIIDVLLQEQQDVENDTNAFTSDMLSKLVRLDSVCREAFRSKNSFLVLPRTNISNESFKLSNGVTIPSGHFVLLNAWSNHHDASLQKDKHGNHQNFEPFRYVNTGQSSTKTGPDYLTFGGGKSACPGRWFAIQEIKIIVSTLIRDYTLTLSGPIKHPPLGVRSIAPSGKVIIQKKTQHGI